VAPCGGFNDTLCSGCRRGQFSSLTVNGRECMECESCLPQRTVSSPCTATQNNICGRCSEGYFLYVDNQGSECRRCSRCPVDRVVIHWIDCAEAGEPVDNQCAPGESTVSRALASCPCARGARMQRPSAEAFSAHGKYTSGSRERVV
jgi:hypothetical protein